MPAGELKLDYKGVVVSVLRIILKHTNTQLERGDIQSYLPIEVLTEYA
jgi:hypothetical protein